MYYIEINGLYQKVIGDCFLKGSRGGGEDDVGREQVPVGYYADKKR